MQLLQDRWLFHRGAQVGDRKNSGPSVTSVPGKEEALSDQFSST
jgi:hypothetical protein